MRVAVTGVGALTPMGATAPEFWNALIEGRSGIAPLEGWWTPNLRFPNGSQMRGWDPSQHFDIRTIDLLDPFAQFATVAGREALSDAGLSVADVKGPRTAILTGCCGGGQGSEDIQFQELYEKKTGRVHPMTIPRIMSNAAASYLSMELGVSGPVYSVSTACASSGHAIGQGFWMVRSGIVDRAIVGGSEALFSFGFLKAWEAMRVVSQETCRPFSKDRKGLILGEGSAMLVLEPLDVAKARGARIYAELAGAGMSADAHHITQPSVDGPALAMRAALADASMALEEIGYVNAHGTGTLANDSTECRAIHCLFGEHAKRLAVSSTKSMHGHALGAAGALEAVATVLALREGILPPTMNYSTPDPECDVDVIPNAARKAQVGAALSNSFAFGGLNAVLCFRSPASL
ncbi:MAG TPA: beta-ketoacyl-[acyl-carrier-protein] synthase family protein [Bryobacteraceae bacterium]|nr:beta-ketoacyl-[acyl-carrier-protein] synthase family protein [Bryobacteraceae bacterium]